jgi:hypothetical protein
VGAGNKKGRWLLISGLDALKRLESAFYNKRQAAG